MKVKSGKNPQSEYIRHRNGCTNSVFPEKRLGGKEIWPLYITDQTE
jgi:hypothetical protein